MSSSEFFPLYFSNLSIFLPLLVVVPCILYLLTRNITIAGYADPWHFYWAFTFGTAYSLIIGMWLIDIIDSKYLIITLLSGFVFITSVNVFNNLNYRRSNYLFLQLITPSKNEQTAFLIVLLIYAIVFFALLKNTGLGIFAEQNRFEQNRGHGMFVRIADALRLFICAYLFLLILKKFKQRSRTYLAYGFLLILIAIFSSLMNGSKMALLEVIYALTTAACLKYGKPRIKVLKIFLTLSFVSMFALIGLSINLKNNEMDDNSAQFIAAPLVIERLFFRIIGNGDKYYLSLPNNVIEDIESDSLIIRLLSPIVGSTRLSTTMGYNVSNFSVGKQILLAHDPEHDLAGGPTSHFDLFSYIYISPKFYWLGSILFAFIIIFFNKMKCLNIKSDYAIALIATLWLRSLPIIIEPPIGIAYLVDIFVIFFSINILVKLIKCLELSR